MDAYKAHIGSVAYLLTYEPGLLWARSHAISLLHTITLLRLLKTWLLEAHGLLVHALGRAGHLLTALMV